MVSKVQDVCIALNQCVTYNVTNVCWGSVSGVTYRMTIVLSLGYQKREQRGAEVRKIRPYSLPLLIATFGALLLVIFGVVTGMTILYAFALASLSLGFGISGLMLALKTEEKMAEIKGGVEQIKALQEELKKAQDEQPGSHKPIIATLEGLTQYYMGYIDKKKRENEEQSKEADSKDRDSESKG